MSATTSIRQAARSPQMNGLARLGLAARATIYLLIGWLAVLLATGKRRGETDQRGALNEVARHTGGQMLLWLITAGLAAYALWRFSEAAFGVAGEGNKKGPRLQSLVRGCIYAALAVNAFNLVVHGRQQSQVRQQQTWTAKVMSHTGGRWAIGILGAIILAVGLALVVQGLTHKFEKNLELQRMSPTTRRAVRALGTVGTAARGVVFMVAGFFVVRAAYEFDPKAARGLDGALRALADTPAGPWLLGAAALGLIAFGVYGYAEAVWHRA
jgi:high-affinity Fe2+/Pb2+ permease